MELITATELADLSNCSVRTVQRNVKNGMYVYKETMNELNKKIFMFPVADLPLELQEKYYMNKYIEDSKVSADQRHLTHKEREEIEFWMEIMKRWREERNKSSLTCEEVDEAFCSYMKLEYPEVTFSRRVLYKKWEAYRNQNYEGLLDGRGKKNKGRTKVTQEMLDAFLNYYLDEAHYSYMKCYEFMKLEIRKTYPEQYNSIPSLKTIQRQVENKPKQALILGREGNKVWEDICSYYVERITEDLLSDDWWVGDTHTIDVISEDENGKRHRLHLNAWMDVRSGIFTGWCITNNAESQATIYSLRDGILKRNSIPRNVYIDNGREYLNHDIGGLGHRAKKKNKNKFNPPPIFKRLGIEMTNAIVKNAKAKVIERRFKDFKEEISKLFHTYTGGSIAERPDILKVRVKNGEVIVDQELKDKIDDIIEYYFNYKPYNGACKEDIGKRRIEVYNEQQKRVKRASLEELELMLMRSSRPKKVGRKGIDLAINGDKFWYFDYDFVFNYFDKQVYYRYDPDDLREIRVYDLEDRYITNLPIDNDAILKYGASKEDIKNTQRKMRKMKKYSAEAVNVIKKIGHTDALTLTLEEVNFNKENPAPSSNPKLLEIQRAVEKVTKVYGSDYEIDMDKMLKNVQNK